MTGIGRADRMRIEARLAVARRGAELLDRKQRILADELERVRIAADRQREHWEKLAAEAAVWLARAAALDGASGIAAARPVGDAEARLSWSTTMGVRFPAEAALVLPEAEAPSGSSALSFAARAHQAALEAAVRHAAAEAAVRSLDAELAAIRLRANVVERHWVPRLEGELAVIRRRLDDLELEEGLRLRWAAGRREETPA